MLKWAFIAQLMSVGGKEARGGGAYRAVVRIPLQPVLAPNPSPAEARIANHHNANTCTLHGNSHVDDLLPANIQVGCCAWRHPHDGGCQVVPAVFSIRLCAWNEIGVERAAGVCQLANAVLIPPGVVRALVVARACPCNAMVEWGPSMVTV